MEFISAFLSAAHQLLFSESNYSKNERNETEESMDRDTEIVTCYLLAREKPVKLENYMDVMHKYYDSVFKDHFRLHKNVVYLLIAEYEKSSFFPAYDSSGRSTITAEQAVLMFLR